MKRWTIIFRVLSNINRLKIIDILSSGKKKSVTEISKILNISLKATSNHLAMLKNLNVLESEGSAGHVFYWINKKMPGDFRIILNHFNRLIN